MNVQSRREMVRYVMVFLAGLLIGIDLTLIHEVNVQLKMIQQHQTSGAAR